MQDNQTNLAIISAIAQARALADTARTDTTLGAAGSAIAMAWELVFTSLVESARPNPEIPGSTEEWAHRQPLIQQMSDLITAAMMAIRRRESSDVVAKLQLDLAKLKAELSAGHSPVASAIDFANDKAAGRSAGRIARHQQS